ncbi:hypothetical protein Tco_0467617 [Tanacetum coccineum]
MSALAQSSGSTTLPNLFADNSGEESDDDDDACIKIPRITPIRSAILSPVSRNQGWPSAAEGPTTRGQGHYDRDISGDAIHRDFFPFSHGPYYVTYPKGGFASDCKFSREEWDAPYQPTLVVLMKDCSLLSDDVAWGRTSCLIQGSAPLSLWLSSSDGAFAKAKAKGKEQKKKIKLLTKNLDQMDAEVACLSTALNQATVLEAEKDMDILWLKASPREFVSFF